MKILKIIGKAPINIKLLLIGKISLVSCWLFFIVKLFLKDVVLYDSIINQTIAFIILIIGITFVVLSVLVLKEKTRIGLYDDNERVELKKNGIYKISRNPMYIGFDLLCIASVVYSINIINLMLCLIAMIIHHKIILAEEKYLKNILKKEWDIYCNQTRRYI